MAVSALWALETVMGSGAALLGANVLVTSVNVRDDGVARDTDSSALVLSVASPAPSTDIAEREVRRRRRRTSTTPPLTGLPSAFTVAVNLTG